jgi:NAD-dependent dihydropyrimidine dehydrogenase PreA subunit
VRHDAIFIGIEVSDDAAARDPALAAKLEETCPVDIYADAGGRVEIVERNIDECILCDMCIAVAPAGAVAVHRLYDPEAVLP